MESTLKQSVRLSDKDHHLRPFLRAHECEGCELYWVGVASFPIPSSQRAWLSCFLSRFTENMGSELQLRGEYFLQFKAVNQIQKRFRLFASQLMPQAGLPANQVASACLRPQAWHSSKRRPRAHRSTRWATLRTTVIGSTTRTFQCSSVSFLGWAVRLSIT
jgi:hypothetical protein